MQPDPPVKEGRSAHRPAGQLDRASAETGRPGLELIMAVPDPRWTRHAPGGRVAIIGQSAGPEITASESVRVAATTQRVLVVEDNPDGNELLCAVLMKA